MENKTSKLDLISDFINQNKTTLSYINPFSGESMFNSKSIDVPVSERDENVEVVDTPDIKKTKIFGDQLASLKKLTDSIESISKRLDSVKTSSVINNFTTNENYNTIKNSREADKNYSIREFSPRYTKEDINKSVNLFVEPTITVPGVDKVIENPDVQELSANSPTIEKSFMEFERMVSSGDTTTNIFSSSSENLNSISNPISTSFTISEDNRELTSDRVSNILNENKNNKNSFYNETLNRSMVNIKNVTNADNMRETNKSFNKFYNGNTSRNVEYLTSSGDTIFKENNEKYTTQNDNKTFVANVVKTPKTSVEKIYNENQDNQQYTFFAEGGYVDSATKAIVGEAGPEIITPLEKVPEILAQANTIEKANQNLSKNATATTMENQSEKLNRLDQQESEPAIPPLPIPLPSDAPSTMDSSAPSGGAGASTRINESLREVHTIPTWRQKLG